jgi:hypothetical protein
VNDILKIKLPAAKTPDWVAWNYENIGIFLVHSAYHLALTIATDMDEVGNSSGRDGEWKVWSKIWKLPVFPKVHNFIWKMVHNGLPKNENWKYRHIADYALCELCYGEREDTFHAVVGCPHAKALRMAMKEIWELPNEERLRNDGSEWFLALLDSCREDVMANLVTVMWRAWMIRNKVTRAREVLSIDKSVGYLTCLGGELQEIKVKTGVGHKGSTGVHPCRQEKEARAVSGCLLCMQQ